MNRFAKIAAATIAAALMAVTVTTLSNDKLPAEAANVSVGADMWIDPYGPVRAWTETIPKGGTDTIWLTLNQDQSNVHCIVGAVVNITVYNSTNAPLPTNGFGTAYARGARPQSSIINWTAGQLAVANQVVIPTYNRWLGGTRQVSIRMYSHERATYHFDVAGLLLKC